MAHDQKTEKPTPRRRQKAREKGQVARSRELAAALAALSALAATAYVVPAFAAQWKGLLMQALRLGSDRTFAVDRVIASFGHASFIPAIGAALAVTWLVATATLVAQGGIVFAPTALAPNLKRISPGTRLQQMFSLSAVRGLLKSLLPAGALLYLAFSLIRRDWLRLPALADETARSIAAFVLSRMFEISWKAMLVLLAWAGLDYLFEHHHLENELRMSRQELIDEFKETEGHPTIKARIRRMQRQVRRRRMLEDVKRASVVLTNPNEFAVALEYRLEMGAPVMVAKGRNRLALEIKQMAYWHDIPLLENPPLARALYRAVEVGQAIPPKLYTVVAEILAVLFRAQAHAHGGRA